MLSEKLTLPFKKIILLVMDKESVLKKLGLSDKEAKIYLKSLEMGTFSVAGISSASGIKRPTCYLILDELIKKGFILHIPRAKKALYVAEDPEVILENTQEKLKLAENIVPQLKKLINNNSNKPIVKYYSTKKGIHGIFNEILKCKSKKYSFVGSGKDVIEVTGKDFIDKWLEKKEKLQIESSSIRMKSTEVLEDIYQNQKNSNLRLAPDDIHIPETIFIYDNKVAVISTKKEDFGFVVQSKDFSESMTGLFKALWKLSKEQKTSSE